MTTVPGVDELVGCGMLPPYAEWTQFRDDVEAKLVAAAVACRRRAGHPGEHMNQRHVWR